VAARNNALEHALARSAASMSTAAAIASAASLDEIAASTEETLVLYDLASGLTGHVELGDVGDVISKHLRRIIPASDVVFYIYDSHTDHLVSAHAAGSHSSNLVGLRIPRGERLSGWVAANRQTILNADPVLDLGDIARSLKPRLRSCMSTPLVCGQELIGVLALYSADLDAFNEDHKRILEVVGRQVSQTVHNALSFERHRASDLRDRATGLPNVRHFERMFAAASANVLPEDKVSIVSVTIKHSSRHLSNASAVPDTVIETVAQAVRRALRGGDLLFRYASNELVVLLTQTDSATADLVAQRIKEATDADLSSQAEAEFSVSVALGVATAPVDGLSVHDLVEAARVRERASSDKGNTPSVH
jgi:diguanylate cyclase (GGDEF)-like protein